MIGGSLGWLAAALVVCGGATLQGSVGIGLSLFAVPLLLLLDPVFVPGPLLAAGATLTLLMTHRDRHRVDLRGIGWTTGGRLGGTLLGAAALVTLPPHGLTLALAGLILLAVAMSVVGLRVRPTSRVLLAAGLLSGVMGTTASIAGPPLALAYQHEAGPRLRGTLAANLLIGALLSLVAIAAVGRFGAPELRATAILVPGILAGFGLSRLVAHRLDRGWLRTAVLGVATLGALSLLVREGLR